MECEECKACPASQRATPCPLTATFDSLLAQDALQHWRTKIAANGREWEERNRALRAEKDLMGRHYAHLKARMDALRAGQVRAPRPGVQIRL